jgi:hypothetical protein
MCIHSAICFNGLPTVFDPRSRPWVTPEGASSDEIMKQIDRCPSGALSYYKNNEVKSEPVNVTGESIVEVVPNGPLMVYGNLKVKSLSGEEQSKNKVTAFCRCGASSNKPYCDGTHRKNNFQG